MPLPCKNNNYGNMSDTDIVNLILLWGNLFPYEPNAHDTRMTEAKWEIENIYHIEGFFAPDFDEGTLFEDSLQKHRESYIIWK